MPGARGALPKIIFGTSSLGNLFVELDAATKRELVQEVIERHAGSGDAAVAPVFDSAGKYGAGLALESLGAALKALGVPQKDVQISNKLGWRRIPLTTPEPTFEPGAWVNLKHDAVQDISYDGILKCYREGNELLGDYNARIVSVHDPDEYLAAAADEGDLARRRQDVLDAYRALIELRDAGEVDSVGVGAKDVSVIDFISDHVKLDWAMFACSVTPYVHLPSTMALLEKLKRQGVLVINSAVFNAGFLVGSDNFNYKEVARDTHADMYKWRDEFHAICKEFNAKPAEVCVQFSFLFDAIVSIALNTSKPSRVKGNIDLAQARVPDALWQAMKDKGLLSIDLGGAGGGVPARS